MKGWCYICPCKLDRNREMTKQKLSSNYLTVFTSNNGHYNVLPVWNTASKIQMLSDPLKSLHPKWLSDESTCQCRRHRRLRFDPWVGKIHWRRQWHPTPVFFPVRSPRERSLEDYNPWDHKESEMIWRWAGAQDCYLYYFLFTVILEAVILNNRNRGKSCVQNRWLKGQYFFSNCYLANFSQRFLYYKPIEMTAKR